MKVKAIVRFDDAEHVFIVPCGNGDKTFKWLGNAISQRYSLSAPNGSIRSRENFYGISDRVQYMTNNITVPSGENPHPAEFLHDHLHDGDSVLIDMSSRIPVKKVSGAPNATGWTKLAYSVSQDHLHADLAEPEDDDEEYYDEEEEVGDDDMNNEGLPASEILAKRAAKVNFMKVVLHSQLIDEKEVSRQVSDIWGMLSPKLRLMKVGDQDDIKHILEEYWDIFLDIFAAYQAPDEALPKSAKGNDAMIIDLERFLCLVDDASIFAAVHAHAQASMLFRHALEYFPMSGGHGLYIEGFIMALILISQLKYNDTLDSKLRSPQKPGSLAASQSATSISLKKSESAAKITMSALGQFSWSCVDDFRRLVEDYFLPLAKELGCHSHLRSVFLSAACLSKIRDAYSILQSTFDKESVKNRDFPTTISKATMSELLYNAGLVATMGTTADIDKCGMLLEEVRHGTIYGRRADVRNDDERFSYPDDEFTLAEFIEAVARAGYYFFKDAAQKKAAAAAAAGTPLDPDEEVRRSRVTPSPLPPSVLSLLTHQLPMCVL